MRVLITGANGFVGQALARRLLTLGHLRGERLQLLRLLDTHFTAPAQDPRVRLHEGSVADAALLRRVLADGIDVVFHLVSIAGGAAEQNYPLGYQVNLLASLELLEQLRQAGTHPLLVFASSVAVYGAALPARMDEHRPAHPALSYGAHKRMIEIAIEDLARRGEVDGRALRLPGIVARPAAANGLRSAFMSDLMNSYASGQAYTCPVSPQATAWWMSVSCCADNLLRAAEVSGLPIEASRVWQVPVLRLSIAEVVDALADRYGDAGRARLRYEPDPELERLFGAYPVLRAPRARALGLRHDGTASALVRNALTLYPAPKRALHGAL